MSVRSRQCIYTVSSSIYRYPVVFQHQPWCHGNYACERLSPPPALHLNQQGFSPPSSSNAVVRSLKIFLCFFVCENAKSFCDCQTTTAIMQSRHMNSSVSPHFTSHLGPMIQTGSFCFVCSWIEFSRNSFCHEQEVVWLQCTDVRYKAVVPISPLPVLLLEN